MEQGRMACFVGMLISLMGVGTVNLAQLALTFPSRARIPSRYRRMQRFFSGHWIGLSETATNQLMKLDKIEARRITTFLRQRLSALDTPRGTGEPLIANVAD